MGRRTRDHGLGAALLYGGCLRERPVEHPCDKDHRVSGAGSARDRCFETMEIRSAGQFGRRKRPMGHHYVQLFLGVVRTDMRTHSVKLSFIVFVLAILSLGSPAHADKKSVPIAPPKASAHPAAPTAAAASPTVKQSGQGEMDVNITGKNREKLVVGKLDPPAAFNLEDIQNFPEDRLQPLLNSPVTFNEGRDFSSMMDFKEDQPIHPWLPEIAKTPFLQMKSPPLEKP